MAELLAAERPALLVPFPYASDNHQWFNAEVLRKAGLAHAIEEKDLNPVQLAGRLREWIENPFLLRDWQARISESPLLDLPHLAAERLAESVIMRPA